MQDRRSNFEYEDLLACGRGELFVEDRNCRCRHADVRPHFRNRRGGRRIGKGLVRAVLELKPDLWFFPCHFKGDPVMPGCLGLDALWQRSVLPWLARLARQKAARSAWAKSSSRARCFRA